MRFSKPELHHFTACPGLNDFFGRATSYDWHKEALRMPSDREQLLEMGFDPDKVDIALKKTGGCKSEFAQYDRIVTDAALNSGRCYRLARQECRQVR